MQLTYVYILMFSTITYVCVLFHILLKYIYKNMYIYSISELFTKYFIFIVDKLIILIFVSRLIHYMKCSKYSITPEFFLYSPFWWWQNVCKMYVKNLCNSVSKFDKAIRNVLNDLEWWSPATARSHQITCHHVCFTFLNAL